MRNFLLTLFLALFISACAVKDFQRFDKNDHKGSEVKEVPESVYKQERVFEWKIQQGDRVEITAFNQSSNSGGQLSELLNSGGQRVYTQRIGDEGMLIGADGMVNLPLIGNIKISGLTEKQASEKLIEEYKQYLRNPYVAVKILNQRLFVLGEVRKPGVVLVTNGTMSLFEALASSGDISDYADRTAIRVIRGDMRQPEVRTIDMTDFASMTASSLILRPNDVVYVASRDDRASMIGFDEELPWARFLATLLQPFSTAAVVYGVTK
ncbi:MAG: polysaccharide biosynthesis/export family protein [Campylobacterales bacterium]|nr:polysaccharide biosynthesis/export family protein [Campylobacterales bacterium]